MIRAGFGAAVLVAAVPLLAGGAHAADWPDECAEATLPSDDPRYPADQLILTCMPSNFNGHLIVYAHGYVRPQKPLALPEELGDSDVEELIERLLQFGFAVATTSYHKNGYAVEQAEDDINDLVDLVGSTKNLDEVSIIGVSEGALIATMLVEKYPDTYAGALAACGPLAGMAYQIRYLADTRLVFDYYFPWVFPFGVYGATEDDWRSWRGADGFRARIAEAIADDPDATEQLFDVVRMPCDPADPDEAANCAEDVLAYSVFGVPDLLETAGGRPYRNLTKTYSGSDDDLGLNLRIERVDADPGAPTYVHRYYLPTGNLERPLITMHTTGDHIVPFWHELQYFSRAQLAGRGAFLTTFPVERQGHCAFRPEELIGGLGALLLRVDEDLAADLLRTVDWEDLVDLDALGGRLGDLIEDRAEDLLEDIRDVVGDTKDDAKQVGKKIGKTARKVKKKVKKLF